LRVKDFRCCKLKAEQWLGIADCPGELPPPWEERLGSLSQALATLKGERCARSLLSGDTESAASSAGGLGLLTSDLEAPEVSQTSVSSDLLQSFQIFSELGVDSVREELRPGALADISLSVKEPLGDVVVYMMESLRESRNLPVGLARMSLIFSMSASTSSPALLFPSI